MRAWLASLPRPVESEVALQLIQIFATRQVQYRRNLRSTAANPFAGLDDISTLAILADALPAASETALQRQSRVRQLAIRILLGDECSMSEQFANETSTLLKLQAASRKS